MADPSINDLPIPPLPSTDQSVIGAVTCSAKRLAFWAAIALPFLHLPLLTTGLKSRTTALAFVVLLALNVVTVVVGHYHE